MPYSYRRVFEESQVSSLEKLTGSPQLLGRQPHQHSMVILLVQLSMHMHSWALRPSSCPLMKQSVVLSGAVHVCPLVTAMSPKEMAEPVEC